MQMVKLLHVNDYLVDTSKFKPLLNDGVVKEFEQAIAAFVGAKHAVSLHSATSAIFLSLLNKNVQVSIPSILPPVVANAIITSGNNATFNDNTSWVGHSYILHQFNDYKIIDSAQKIYENQFEYEAGHDDLIIYSFYPTKPIGSSDGGMIVSNDKDKIDKIRMMSRNGNTLEKNSWERQVVCPGYKLYMNSIQCYIAMKNFHKLKDKDNELKQVRNLYNEAFNLNNSSCHLYRMNVENRDTFVNEMNEKNIQTGIHYRALHLIDCYNQTHLSLPKSEMESKTTVSLPFHEKLTREEIEFVIQSVKPYVKT